MKCPDPILLGLTGSRAYGLDHPGSDYDWRGIFVKPTDQILSLSRFQGTDTVEYAEDEANSFVLHEVGKFIHLALAGNPTILEQLFLEEYRALTRDGQLLVDIRDCFLSRRVRDSYGGYAVQQVQRLRRREREGYEGFGPALKKRRAKHAMHCFRLLTQGYQLLTLGRLEVRLPDPDFYRAIGDLSTEELNELFEWRLNELDAAVADSPLPPEPDFDTANEILLTIRRSHL